MVSAVSEADKAKDQLTSLANLDAPEAPGAPSNGLGGLTGKSECDLSQCVAVYFFSGDNPMYSHSRI